MHSLLASQLAVLSFVPAFVSATSWNVGNAVKLAAGPIIQGHASSWQPSVSEYLGIPFAEPPVGPLRFAAPKPWKSGPGVFLASKFSPSCPANLAGLGNASTINSPKGVILASLGQFGDTFDEDCLTVNVWTKPQTGEKAKAVLAWIYGGGFALGYTSSPTYNGARLAAEEDVVVVSINYRLNILGFPGAPGLPDQNLGLLDQRLAVEWIRDNIVAFGGDPKRITLFGESAGGASVDLYSYAWTKDPIVNAFIPQSGTASLIDALGATQNKAAKWFSASEKAGCGSANTTTAAASIQCMRSKPWKTLLTAIKPVGPGEKLGGMGDYGPSPDGKVVFSDTRARAASGNFIKRPMLVGNNANEVSLFSVILGSTAGLASSLFQYANAIFNCPSGSAATARNQNKVKAWRYLYAGDWPNKKLAEGAGPFHGSEIGAVFGTSQYEQKYYGDLVKEKIDFPDTPEQIKLTKTMMNAWASFAKDPENALTKLGWPTYDGVKPTLIKLGGENSSDVTFVDPATVDLGCGFMNSLQGFMSNGGLPNAGSLFGGQVKGGSGFDLASMFGAPKGGAGFDLASMFGGPKPVGNAPPAPSGVLPSKPAANTPPQSIGSLPRPPIMRPRQVRRS